MKLKLFSGLAVILTFLSLSAFAANEFPGRKVYANIPHISTEQLYQQRQQSIIIDARSKQEFQTLRIKDAVNVPLSLSKDNFLIKLKHLRKDNTKALVFYCNGHSCMKSYKAARRAILFGKLKNVYAYDAGIFDWTRQYPDEAELLGKSPVKPEQLIPKSTLKKHTLPALDFIRKASGNTEILDIRDRSQRDGFYVFAGYEHSIPLGSTKKLTQYIRKVKRQNKTLFVYDAVGKQVRWLQYYLEELNIKNYYFMKGGARAYFDIPRSELID